MSTGSVLDRIRKLEGSSSAENETATSKKIDIITADASSEAAAIAPLTAEHGSLPESGDSSEQQTRRGSSHAQQAEAAEVLFNIP